MAEIPYPIAREIIDSLCEALQTSKGPLYSEITDESWMFRIDLAEDPEAQYTVVWDNISLAGLGRDLNVIFYQLSEDAEIPDSIIHTFCLIDAVVINQLAGKLIKKRNDAAAKGSGGCQDQSVGST